MAVLGWALLGFFFVSFCFVLELMPACFRSAFPTRFIAEPVSAGRGRSECMWFISLAAGVSVLVYTALVRRAHWFGHRLVEPVLKGWDRLEAPGGHTLRRGYN